MAGSELKAMELNLFRSLLILHGLKKSEKGENRSYSHCLQMFAIRLVMAGVDIRTVKELLGHKTIVMTGRYSHLAPKHTLPAVERLNASTETPTDTTADTRALECPGVQAVVLH